LEKECGKAKIKMDEVNTDARRMGKRMWWGQALYREEWRKLLVEAKTV
jgi:hypothetical protein